MHVPRRFLAFVAFALVGAARSEVPENLVAEGIPEPGDELRRAVQPYLESRAAAFQDWHPRHRDVLFTTRFADTAQLHLNRLPGGARQQLTFLTEPVTSASFGPGDGDIVVFSQDRGGSEFFQLYRLDVANGRVSMLTDGKSRNTNARWSADGRQIAYASTRRNGRDTDFYAMDPRSPGTDRRVAELTGNGWVVLDWSPDASQLLALAYVSINESQLHLVDVATGTRRPLTHDGASRVSYAGGRFLPGGRSVLTTTDLGSEFRQMAKLDLATGAISPFGPQVPWDVEDFDLSADGRTLAFFSNEDGTSVLHLVDVRTGRPLRTPRIPMGVASGLRWHQSRRELGFSLTSARSPNDVYSVDTRMNELTRWTESETGGLSSGRFSEPETIRTQGADGVSLSGLFYRPDARRFPGPRPVLVNIHGGPESQARPIFQARWNYLIDELGIAVLYPNVRGSAGYGKTFLTLDDGMKREDTLKDIGSFLDWIGRQPGLDPGRVGVYGGSYGGYMVLASLVHFGDRLRCGVDVVGISSFLSFLKNTQDYRRDLRRAEYGDERIPDMNEFLRRISPLTQVSRIRKPLLVVQGQNDPRVPVTEAEQMVKAIRDQGGAVWYLLARDEGHGFAKKRNSDYLFLALVQFVQQHLLQSD